MHRPLPAWLLFVAAASVQASDPVPFQAEFELHRNGKLMGESRIDLEVEPEQWALSSHSRGTKGLARVVGFEEMTRSQGDWQDGLPRPHRFEQDVSVAIKKIHSEALFNWHEGKVATQYDDGEAELDIESGTLDASTLTLWLQVALARGETEWTVQMVDEDEVETSHFRVADQRKIDTALGCLSVKVVEKVRPPESTRYTRTYFAEDLGHVPVLVELGKTDGDHMATQLRSLTLSGSEVEPRPACS